MGAIDIILVLNWTAVRTAGFMHYSLWELNPTFAEYDLTSSDTLCLIFFNKMPFSQW